MLRYGSILIGLLLLTACDSQTDVPLGVQYPANYRTEFVHYATVDRRDGIIRDLYINPIGLNSLSTGSSLPSGTVLVIEAYDAQQDENGEFLTDSQGHFIKGEIRPQIHIAEKRRGWRPEDFENGQLSDDWNFGSYAVDTHTRFDEQLTACFNCHNTTSRSDFVWSLPLILRYNRSQQPQYLYCDQSGRTPCDL